MKDFDCGVDIQSEINNWNADAATQRLQSL